MKTVNVYIMGIIYLYLGILHFTNTEFYYPYMPKFLPFHWELIIASGIAEIILGIGVLFERSRNYSLWYFMNISCCKNKFYMYRRLFQGS